MFGEHLHVICFASCYVAALVCEVLRLAYRGALRRRVIPSKPAWECGPMMTLAEHLSLTWAPSPVTRRAAA